MDHILKIREKEITLQEDSSGNYTGNLGSLTFQVHCWTFGDHCRALDFSTRYHRSANKYYTDTIVYNEMLLEKCIVAIQREGQKIKIETLQAYEGDMLLEICGWLVQQSTIQIPNEYQPTFQSGEYVVEIPNLKAHIKPWTWGIKTNVVRLSSIYVPEANEMHMSMGMFGEYLLQHTLLCLEYNGEKQENFTLESIRKLQLDVGTFLMQVSMFINQLPELEKKT